MTSKEKFFEIKNALKEKIVNNATAIKADKSEHKKVKQWYKDIGATQGYELSTEQIEQYREQKFFSTTVGTLEKEDTTAMHILYNRIRQRPAHTGSYGSDEAYLGTHGTFFYGKLIKSILEDHTVRCEPCEEHLEMFEVESE